MRRFHVWLAVGGLMALSGLPTRAVAQGFSVNEHGSCSMGRAGTGVAQPCEDGSAMFYNPAGLAGMAPGRWVISAGGTGIAPTGGFTADATSLESKLNSHVFPVPSLYITRGISDRVAAGVGLFAPYGLTTDWPTNSAARFLGYKSVIRAIYIQPTVAAKLGSSFKLGAGFDFNLFHVQLRQRVDLSEQVTTSPPVTFGNLGIPAGTDFADVNLHGNATGVGYHVGAIFQPSERLSLGIRFLSRQKVTVDGAKAEINQVYTGILLPPGNPLGAPTGTPLDSLLVAEFRTGPLQDQGGSTVVRLPEQIGGGVMVSPIDKLKLFFDVTWQNWKVFETLTITTDSLPTTVIPENFKAVAAWRYGAEYAVSPTTALRAGYLTHGAAEPAGSVTPNLPEGKRSEFTLGLGTRVAAGLHLDLAYQYIQQQNRRGRTTEFGTPDNGLFKFKAHLFGAHLTYTF